MTRSFISRQHDLSVISETIGPTDSIAMDNYRMDVMLSGIKALRQSDVDSVWAKDTLFE